MAGPAFQIAEGVISVRTEIDQRQLDRLTTRAGDRAGFSFDRSLERRLNRDRPGIFNRFLSRFTPFGTQAGDRFSSSFRARIERDRAGNITLGDQVGGHLVQGISRRIDRDRSSLWARLFRGADVEIEGQDRERFQRNFLGQLFKPIPALERGLIYPLAQSLSTPFGLLLAAGVATAFVGFLGPAILTAVAGGLGGLLLGVGILGAAADKKLQDQFSKTGKTLTNVFHRVTAPLVGPLIRGLERIGEAVKRWEPTLLKVFQALAPVVPKIVDGFIGFVDKALPSLLKSMPAVVAFFDQLAKNMPGLGEALGRLFAFLSKPENIAALRSFVDSLFNLA